MALVLFFAFAVSPPVLASALVTVETGVSSRIEGLRIDATPLPLQVIWRQGLPRGLIRLRGEFVRRGWDLLYESGQTLLSENPVRRFDFEVVVDRQLQSIELTAIGPAGELETQQVTFRCKDWEAFLKASGERVGLSLLIGASSVTYRETGYPSYAMLGSTGTLSFRYSILPPRLEIGGNVFATLFPMQTNGNQGVRFIGSNFRFGYVFPFVRAPWRLGLHTGLSYSHMVVTNEAFGYSHLLYPQLYPVIRRELTARYALGAYLKYVLLGKRLSFSSLEREIACGISWEMALDHGRSLVTSLDFSSLRFLSSPGHEHSSTVGSLGVGFAW